MNKKVIITAVAVLMSSAVFAAKKSEAKVDSTKMYELQEVQVVSTRATKKTPIAFSTVKKEDLKSINHGKDIPSLLTQTPSVTMTSDAGNGIGYTSLYVRGSDNTRVNITANGIPLNDAESSGLYWVNMGDFASSAEDIQIQRGVGTSTNGAGAFGATVNIQTEKIGVNPFVGVDLSAGSYYSHKETLRFGTGLFGGHWGVQGRLSNIGSKGYIDRAGTKLNSYFLQAGYFGDNTVVKFITFNGQEETYHAWNYASKYERKLFGRTFNSCGAMSYTDEEGNTYYQPDFTYDADGIAESIGKHGHINYYDNQKDFYHQQHYQLLLNQNLPWNMKLNLGLHYTRGDGYYEQYKPERVVGEFGMSSYFGKPVTIDGQYGYVQKTYRADLINQKKMANDFFGFVASMTYDNKKGLQAAFGGGWNRYLGRHFGYVIWDQFVPQYGEQEVDPYHKYYDNDSYKNDGNIYGKVSYEFLKGLSAYVDLQYRHVSIQMYGPTDEYDYDYMTHSDGSYVYVNKKTLLETGYPGDRMVITNASQVVFNQQYYYDFFNPKFGLNYEINKNHRVYASVGISHKEPTRNDFEDNMDTNLKAEKLTDWELGYKYQSPRFSGGVNLYYMDYTNQFVLTGQLNSIGEPIKKNSGKSYRVGVELEAAWQPLDWFIWSANATFSKNRNKHWTVTTCDGDFYAENWYYKYGETVDLGETPISFSPDVIFNNILTFKYKGFKGSVISRYVSEQYLTNTGFRSYEDLTYTGEKISTMLGGHFTTDIELSYTTDILKKWGMKDAMIGVSLYNVFSEKYDTNGWNYCEVGIRNEKPYAWSDSPCETGLSAAAPFNFMVNMSLNF